MGRGTTEGVRVAEVRKFAHTLDVIFSAVYSQLMEFLVFLTVLISTCRLTYLVIIYSHYCTIGGKIAAIVLHYFTILGQKYMESSSELIHYPFTAC
jgi:hypothetical protein